MQLFGGEIGVKGEVLIALDRDEYRAGDTISGRVRVVVSELILADTSLVFTLQGEESAQWLHNGDHNSRYHEFLRHEILTSVLPNPYPVGEYLYPFEYTLAADLPGMLNAESLIGDSTSLHASIKYTLKASIKIEGKFLADMEATHNLTIMQSIPHTSQSLPGRRPPGSVERTISKRLRMFGCWNLGMCHIGASMTQTVFNLGEAARVDSFVNNHTSKVDVDIIKCRLYQDVKVHHPKGVDLVCSRPLLQVKCPGPKKGEMVEQPMLLDLSAQRVQFPSTKGRFLECCYRIAITCELVYIGRVEVDFPVTILPSPLLTRGDRVTLRPSRGTALSNNTLLASTTTNFAAGGATILNNASLGDAVSSAAILRAIRRSSGASPPLPPSAAPQPHLPQPVGVSDGNAQHQNTETTAVLSMTMKQRDNRSASAPVVTQPLPPPMTSLYRTLRSNTGAVQQSSALPLPPPVPPLRSSQQLAPPPAAGSRPIPPPPKPMMRRADLSNVGPLHPVAHRAAVITLID